MDQYAINWLDQVPAEIDAVAQAGHVEHETGHGVTCGYRPFALVLRDRNGTVAGLLRAYTAYAEIYVDDLWVAADRRGKGCGRALLEDLENRFTGEGFNNINLVTSAFQGVEFYKACGYTVEFERVNRHNPKLSKTFFIKFFDDVRQHRGSLPATASHEKGAGRG